MRIFIISLLLILLTSCSAGQIGKAVLGAATGGGGPSLEGQIGKENTKQNVGVQVSAGRDVVTRKENVTADRVDKVTVNEVPPWVILLLVLGWLLPSPGEMGRKIQGWFRR